MRARRCAMGACGARVGGRAAAWRRRAGSAADAERRSRSAAFGVMAFVDEHVVADQSQRGEAVADPRGALGHAAAEWMFAVAVAAEVVVFIDFGGQRGPR